MERYFEKIKKLRAAPFKNSPATYNKAPHKPLLLLSVIDLYAQGKITGKIIEHSFDLVDTFNGYWNRIMPIGATTSMAYPFPRLANDKIWKIIPIKGLKGKINIESITSMVKLRSVSNGAEIDDILFVALSNEEAREQLRVFILQQYFIPELHQVLKEQGDVNVKAFKYSEKILQVKDSVIPYNEKDQTEVKVRDQAFRKTITKIYDHRCALCGIRILTPEGHTVVDAAHIIPWSETQNDRLDNGMALCKLCHWSFDEGLIGVGYDYEILVSKKVRQDNNYPGHILSLTERPIFKPSNETYWPGQNNLDWHRTKCFSQ